MAEDLKFTSQKLNTEPSGSAVAIGIATEPEATDEAVELFEEMAATTTLNELFDTFIDNITGWFGDLKYTSEQGNAVKTHIELVATEEDVITEAQALRDRLIESLAKRGEDFNRGSQIIKQVVDATDEES